MIATLSGVIKEKTPGFVIVETGGVGYGVTLPLSSYYELPEVDMKISLLIHTQLREDSLTLFGFMTREEKRMFILLTSVTGIGPKLAINILSGISVHELALAIGDENATKISTAPGVGRKMAQRIILEMKDKVKGAGFEMPSGVKERGPYSTSTSDAKSALMALGYKTDVAGDAVDKILKARGEELAVEELIRESLKSLGR